MIWGILWIVGFPGGSDGFECRESGVFLGRIGSSSRASTAASRHTFTWSGTTRLQVPGSAATIERDKLFEHGVTFNEAVECFFSDFEIRRNKKYRDRYQLIGKTLGGKRLKIIFQIKPGEVIRIITGWPL